MRPQVLRFPVGQQFKKILEDDHEWIVLTDMHLKPLVMRRSNRRNIDWEDSSNAFQTLLKSTYKRKIRVYELHSHPNVKDEPNPSMGDMNSWTKDRISSIKYGEDRLVIAGYGVISRKGIRIIKLRGTEESLTKLLPYTSYKTKLDKHADAYMDHKQEYRKELNERFDNKSGDKNQSESYNNLYTALRREVSSEDQASNMIHKRAFRELRSEEPDIRSRVVRRRHRGGVRR